MDFSNLNRVLRPPGNASLVGKAARVVSKVGYFRCSYISCIVRRITPLSKSSTLSNVVTSAFSRRIVNLPVFGGRFTIDVLQSASIGRNLCPSLGVS